MSETWKCPECDTTMDVCNRICSKCKYIYSLVTATTGTAITLAEIDATARAFQTRGGDALTVDDFNDLATAARASITLAEENERLRKDLEAERKHWATTDQRLVGLLKAAQPAHNLLAAMARGIISTNPTTKAIRETVDGLSDALAARTERESAG